MILIVVKWHVRDEYADRWPELVREFTEATRAEPGNRFFEWSRSVDDPSTWVLVEGFADSAAGAEHVGGAHFQKAIAQFPDYVSRTPEIMYVDSADLDGWGPMAEVQPRG
ncbi:putative quinol monooxygenase [Motilibacter deserti]|uniref:Antibiotic biosynthesis monooxygenase n=1 Tax=Motilibacter deserti TaxID=2714956 RepID=A0ABX0GW82_9ACTN|nr:antibiotic biosynthesis monooxygenase [Motilibacter deserti]